MPLRKTGDPFGLSATMATFTNWWWWWWWRGKKLLASVSLSSLKARSDFLNNKDACLFLAQWSTKNRLVRI